MGRFRNSESGVVVSVDDSKDERFASGWEPAGDEKKTPAKKAAASPKKD